MHTQSARVPRCESFNGSLVVRLHRCVTSQGSKSDGAQRDLRNEFAGIDERKPMPWSSLRFKQDTGEVKELQNSKQVVPVIVRPDHRQTATALLVNRDHHHHCSSAAP